MKTATVKTEEITLEVPIVETATAKTEEITLEVLARTAIEMNRLPKYADVNEYEMIPKAYQFLRACKMELEGAPSRIAKFNAHHAEGTEGPATWDDIRKLTHQERDDEKLIKFFEDNTYWRSLLRSVSKPNEEVPNEEVPKWPADCKQMVLPKTALQDLKAAFEEWWQQEKSKISQANATGGKKKVEKSP